MTYENKAELNTAWRLKKHVDSFPEKAAIIFPQGEDSNGRIIYRSKSFRDIDRESDRAAYVLREAGFSENDRTVFMVKPGPDVYIYLIALLKIGCIPVVVDPGMKLSRMLHCFRSVGAEAFLGLPLASFARIVSPHLFSSIKCSATVTNGRIVGEQRYLRKLSKTNNFPICHKTPNDVALISFTTGSTGPAKGVEYSFAMTKAMIDLIQESYQFKPDDVQLVTLPVFGLLGLLMGNTCVIPKMNATKPANVHAPHIIEAIEKFKATSMFASPSLIDRLAAYGKGKSIQLSTLRVVSSGGAPMNMETMKTFRQMLPVEVRFETTWGATEGLPLTCISIDTVLNETKADTEAGKGFCIGKPFKGVKVKAIPINEGHITELSSVEELPYGEVGELIIQGANVSKHYHRNQAQDRANKIKDGDLFWHRTGDLGWIDKDNRVWFCGRKSHRVTIAKPNQTLYSEQSEGVVNKHCSVYRSALTTAKLRDNSGQKRNVAVMCVELAEPVDRETKRRLETEIMESMKHNAATKNIEHVLFHKSFPVDIRHNAKINREQLGLWATNKLRNIKTS